MLSDAVLESSLRYFAAELASQGEWPDGSQFTGGVHNAILPPHEVAALTTARVYADLDGARLLERLIQAGEATIAPDAQVTDAVAGFFAIWARLLCAFARPLGKPAAGPRQVVISERPKLKARDTIFETLQGKIGEKTGGLDLSEGQPTSTAQYAPQVPEFRAPPNPDTLSLAARMTALGFYTSDEDNDAADTLARLGRAPPAAAPAVKLRVPFPDDGKEKVGTVFVQRPATFAANAPKVLRAQPGDAGPEVPSPPLPPDGEI